MENEKRSPVVKVRKVQQYGRSLYVSRPHEFCRLYGIGKGDQIPVIANHIVKIVPMKEEN